MSIRLVVCAAVIASLAVPAVPALASDERPLVAAPGRSVSYDSGRAIVAIAPGERAEASDAIGDEGGDVVAFSRTGGFFVVETSSDSAEWAEEVENEDSVRYAEPDWLVSAADLVPTDPSWGSLWGARQISAPAAWATGTGSSDVVVGVIDSGVDYTHEDLAAQMWVNPNEDPTTPGDDDGNGWKNDIHGVDCANDDADPADDNGHGTHVAGTIGAAANNGRGVAGVAWNVKIMALKFLSADGTGYTSDAIQCLYYAIDNGAHITNNSWGGPTYSKTLQDAIRYAGERGQLFVAAAGNDGLDSTATPHFPASYDVDNVLSVAASDRSDRLAEFSNHGASVDLAAPGVGILSTVPGGYASYSGTSMAAPHVAGAAALLLGHDPMMRSDVAALRRAILENVDALPSLQGRVATSGRLNVARAIWPDRPESMHVHGLTRRSTTGKRYTATTVTVGISTDEEVALPGATVVLTWSVGGGSSCVTGIEGTCSVSKRTLRGDPKANASVRSVTHQHVSHDAGDAHS